MTYILLKMGSHELYVKRVWNVGDESILESYNVGSYSLKLKPGQETVLDKL